MSDHNDPANAAVKPGAKTSEMYVTLVVAILGAVMASGLLDPADPTQATIAKLIGLVLSVASVLGYQASRTAVKTTANRVAGELAAAQAPKPASVAVFDPPGLTRE